MDLRGHLQDAAKQSNSKGMFQFLEQIFGSHLAHLGRAGLCQKGRNACGRSRRGLGLMLGGCSCYGDILDRNAVRGDVVDLTRCCHVNQVVGLDLDLVARRQESVEAHNEVGVAFEKLRHSADDSRGVNAG